MPERELWTHFAEINDYQIKSCISAFSCHLGEIMPDILMVSPADVLILLGLVFEPIIFLSPLIELWGRRGSPFRLGSSWKIKVTTCANIADRKSRAGLLEREYLSLPLWKIPLEVFIYLNVFKIFNKELSAEHGPPRFQRQESWYTLCHVLVLQEKNHTAADRNNKFMQFSGAWTQTQTNSEEAQFQKRTKKNPFMFPCKV